MWLDFFFLFFFFQSFSNLSLLFLLRRILQKEHPVFPEWTLWIFTVFIISLLIFCISSPPFCPWRKEHTQAVTGTPSLSRPFMPALALVSGLTGITGCTSISPACRKINKGSLKPNICVPPVTESVSSVWANNKKHHQVKWSRQRKQCWQFWDAESFPDLLLLHTSSL